MKEAQGGRTITAASMQPAVDRYLTDVEAILHRDVVESFSPVDWAVLITQARQYKIEPRDLVMEIICAGMKNSATTALNLHKKKSAQAAREKANVRPKPVLKLVK